MKNHTFILITLIIAVFTLLSCEKSGNTQSSTASVTTEALTTELVTTELITTETVTTEAVTTIPAPASYVLQFSPQKDGVYNYCPSVMRSGNTAYIYYCTNTVSHIVTDYIGFRSAAIGADGAYQWSDETIVLSPSADKWDSRHVCDPSVVKGEFTYNGEKYAYLMAYLGCKSDNSQDNEIGLAVSKSPAGPFVKVGEQPFIAFTRDPGFEGFQWGVGQPSLLNEDEKGQIRIFYTRGDKYGTRVIAEVWDLSDLNAPKRKTQAEMGTSTLKNLKDEPDYLNNADFARAGDRFVFVSDCHPDPEGEPTYISSHFRILSFAASSVTNPAFQTVSTVGKDLTGFARNHNCGILRDPYGNLPDEKSATVFYTVSDLGANSLWTYRIYTYTTPIK